jgi:uroporphyrinogen-III decarboxylase
MPSADSIDFDIKQLRELYRPDMSRINLAKKRQNAVWAGKKPDKWPLLLAGELTGDQKSIPQYDLQQAFYNADYMLCNNVREACRFANGNSDIVPSMRANMGTGILMACIGLEQDIFPDKMPWFQKHLSREEVKKLEADDIKIQGSFAMALNHMRRFKEIMGERLPIFCLDTQGPFDLAHLILGDDLFLACYDDPPFVHHLLAFCLELGTKAHMWVKEVIDEPVSTQYHGTIYAENMGIRICEDTTALLGPELIQEFAVPYTRKLAQTFGGAWVHYCGRNDHLTKAICQIPEIRGINFGHIPGHVHDHPFEEDMQRIADAGLVYKGSWPPFDEEKPQHYLKRIHSWASQECCILECLWPNQLLGENGFGSHEEILDFWYSL